MIDTNKLSERTLPPSIPHWDWLQLVVPPVRDVVRASRQAKLHGFIRKMSGVDIDIPESVVLALTRIGDFQPIRLSDLAVQMDVGRTTLSRQLAELETLGCIERAPDPADGRAAFVTLTPTGVEVLRAIWGAWATTLAEVTADWTEDERKVFLELLTRFADGLTEIVRRL